MKYNFQFDQQSRNMAASMHEYILCKAIKGNTGTRQIITNTSRFYEDVSRHITNTKEPQHYLRDIGDVVMLT